MSDDTEILLMKIERQVSRICKALEEKGNDGANEQYLNQHFSHFLKHNFPEYRDAGMAREWFEKNVGGHDLLNIGVDSYTHKGVIEIVPVPTGAARNLFISGWIEAMKAMRRKVQP